MYNHHNHSANDREELMVLIKYMANHNASHTSELDSLLSKLDFAGDDARDLIKNAIECYNNGNDMLNEAIDLLSVEEKGE